MEQPRSGPYTAQDPARMTPEQQHALNLIRSGQLTDPAQIATATAILRGTFPPPGSMPLPPMPGPSGAGAANGQAAAAAAAAAVAAARAGQPEPPVGVMPQQSPAISTPAGMPGQDHGRAMMPQMVPPIAPRAPPPKPKKHKIEYTPIRRLVESFGGYDLRMIDKVLEPVLHGHGRLPRSVRELGESRPVKAQAFDF